MGFHLVSVVAANLHKLGSIGWLVERASMRASEIDGVSYYHSITNERRR